MCLEEKCFFSYSVNKVLDLLSGFGEGQGFAEFWTNDLKIQKQVPCLSSKFDYLYLKTNIQASDHSAAHVHLLCIYFNCFVKLAKLLISTFTYLHSSSYLFYGKKGLSWNF